ncbi:hypothetical protein N7451_007973 [Penicillium sp. IBT 35674x]|nr:hypothetical protein N7451_007973 [Penicillium sp. IBT 35674x]
MNPKDQTFKAYLPEPRLNQSYNAFHPSRRLQNNKAILLVHQASESSASLVVFPESHINLSLWSAPCAPTESHPLFHRMVQGSIYADGRETQLPPSPAAQDTKTTISIGTRKAPNEHSLSHSLYNSNLIIDLSGTVAEHHRKRMPTFFEKLA